MALKQEIGEHLAKYFLRSGRGASLTNHVIDLFKDILDGTVYLFAIKGLFGIIISPTLLVIIVVVKKVGEYFIGWIDEKVGFWKFQNSYSTEHINPFMSEMMDRIKNIENNSYLITTRRQ